MEKTPYNPQQVLSPLMERFGRHLPGPRDEGFERMVATVAQELNVAEPYAKQLTETLINARLLVYESAVPSIKGDSGEDLDFEQTEGRWRLGPIE